MTAAQFVDQVEGYYGRYPNKLIKGMVYAWVAEHVYDFDALFDKLTKLESNRWEKVPDVATIRGVAEGDPEICRLVTIAGQVFYDGSRIGHYDGGQFIPIIPPGRVTEYVQLSYDLQTPEKYIRWLKGEMLSGPVERLRLGVDIRRTLLDRGAKKDRGREAESEPSEDAGNQVGST